MVELYNDQLLDLLDKAHTSKLEIKKDKKGMVVIQNAVIKDVDTTEKLQVKLENNVCNIIQWLSYVIWGNTRYSILKLISIPNYQITSPLPS